MFKSLEFSNKKVKRPRIEDPNHMANYELVYSTRQERVFIGCRTGHMLIRYQPMVRVS